MFLVVIVWAAIVSNLASTTAVYQKCKDAKCEVKVKEIGYEIIKHD